MPVDFLAIIEVCVSEQTKAMPADGPGFADHEINFLRKKILEEFDAPRYFITVEEELASHRAAELVLWSGEIVTCLAGNQINALIQFLANAGTHFVPTHAGQPSPGFAPTRDHEFHLTRGNVRQQGQGIALAIAVRRPNDRCGTVTTVPVIGPELVFIPSHLGYASSIK